jgi:hypothetical protein
MARWVDLERWPSFVDGFGGIVRHDPDWPAVGSEVVWRSGPAGRGEVTERVEAHDAGRIVTRVSDGNLTGTQTATFEAEADGARAGLELEYELRRRGPLTPITDALFIRRAVRDSLRRTLERFGSEVEEDGEPARRG